MQRILCWDGLAEQLCPGLGQGFESMATQSLCQRRYRCDYDDNARLMSIGDWQRGLQVGLVEGLVGLQCDLQARSLCMPGFACLDLRVGDASAIALWAQNICDKGLVVKMWQVAKDKWQ